MTDVTAVWCYTLADLAARSGPWPPPGARVRIDIGTAHLTGAEVDRAVALTDSARSVTVSGCGLGVEQLRAELARRLTELEAS